MNVGPVVLDWPFTVASTVAAPTALAGVVNVQAVELVQFALRAAMPPTVNVVPPTSRFVPVTVTVTSCVAVAPLSSVTVTVKVSVCFSPAFKSWCASLDMLYVHSPVFASTANVPYVPVALPL